jgi:hypothetical protein
MLGRHADHFFATQARERVLAITPNGGGRSLQIPDRERAGSAQVTMRGHTVPGPQRQVSSGYMPGMGTVEAPPAPVQPSGALPGMGGSALPGMGGSALPGMSGGDMLPGMGFLPQNWIIPGIVVGVGAWLLLRKRR